MRGLYRLFVEDFVFATMVLALAVGAFYLAFVHEPQPGACRAGDVRVNGACTPRAEAAR